MEGCSVITPDELGLRTYDIMINSHALLPTELCRINKKTAKQ
mgnify:CR=1 FL=1